MNNLLTVDNLSIEFILPEKRFYAVKDVSFSIAQDETVVLAGESGSGKSVTAASLVRLLPANAHIRSGEVMYKGEDLLKYSAARLTGVRGRQIAYVFQEPAAYLNPVYTIGDQIVESVLTHQKLNRTQARQEMLSLLERVRINDAQRVAQSYPHQLSGGMNQRACIAMSLACKPQLLIADEPTTALDVTIERQILDLLLALKKELGFSMLFITHNLSIAHKIADRVVVMYQGRVVEDSLTADIFAKPKHAHTKELIRAYEKIGKL
jgi:peptide/nickel transport system ATP-binding protein/oligopeptide transport system ATP-binding protein